MPFTCAYGTYGFTNEADERLYQKLQQGQGPNMFVCNYRFGGVPDDAQKLVDDGLKRGAETLPEQKVPTGQISPLQLPSPKIPTPPETHQKHRVRSHLRCESSRWVKISVKVIDLIPKPTTSQDKKALTKVTVQDDDFVIVDAKECDDDWVLVYANAI